MQSTCFRAISSAATAACQTAVSATAALVLLAFLGVAPAGAAGNTGGSPVAETESMTIDGVQYDIPSPWRGNKLEAAPLVYEDFRRLPSPYTFNDSTIYVVRQAHGPLVQMLDAAARDGILLQVESGYRSPAYQKQIFRRLLEAGRDFDDIIRYVAPPGYSEHMLGTAVDFHPSNWRFADTAEHLWLQENAGRFGFINTYSEFNQLQYPWEAWHWNYVGPPLSPSE